MIKLTKIKLPKIELAKLKLPKLKLSKLKPSELKRPSNRVTAVIVFALSLIVNALAGTTILGGNTTAEVSDAYPNLFAPVGLTFVIWGVIYLLLIIFCIRLFMKPKTDSEDQSRLLVPLTKQFIVVSALNAVWLFTWQYRVIWLSVLLIIAMLERLIRITSLIANSTKPLLTRDWFRIKLPFSVYFGWITIATIANIVTFLVSIKWSGFGLVDQTWTVVILIIGAIIGLVTAFRRADWAYLAVFVWAYFGIWLKHVPNNQGFNGAYPAVISLLEWLIPLLVAGTVWLGYEWNKARTSK